MYGGIKNGKKLYELKMYGNYSDDLNKYIFRSMESAQKYMRKKWEEAINTDDYDYIPGNGSIRYSDNIIFDKTYYEDDYAVVKWKEDGICQIIQFNIEEVEDMMDWN